MSLLSRLKKLYVRTSQYIKYGRNLREFHSSCLIEKPLLMVGKENISLKPNSFIKKNAIIFAIPMTGSDTVEFVLGENSHLNYGAHISAAKSIVIGDNVNIAPYVYISDNTHSYKDVSLPIKFSPIEQLKTVTIGEGTWIGTRAAVFGCSIGKHCIIGANSVVNKDIPDYCVVGGIPAKILKRYDFEKKEWRKTDKAGNFVD